MAHLGRLALSRGENAEKAPRGAFAPSDSATAPVNTHSHRTRADLRVIIDVAAFWARPPAGVVAPMASFAEFCSEVGVPRCHVPSCPNRATGRTPALTAGQESRSSTKGYCREVFFAALDGARIRSAAQGGPAARFPSAIRCNSTIHGRQPRASEATLSPTWHHVDQ
jgi:hypothetical protein